MEQLFPANVKYPTPDPARPLVRNPRVQVRRFLSAVSFTVAALAQSPFVPLEIGHLNFRNQRTDLDGRTVPRANWKRFAPDLCQLLNSDPQPGTLLKARLSGSGTA